MKDMGTSYVLAVLGFVTPFAGLHRFYLGRPISGILYFCTWGFLGLGTFIDLFVLPGMVREENRKLLPPGDVHVHVHGQDVQVHGSGPRAALRASPPRALPEPKKSAEQLVLELANRHEGAVTVEMIALETSLSLEDARRELERLKKAGYCTVDVSVEGAYLYIFPGLKSNRPFEIE